MCTGGLYFSSFGGAAFLVNCILLDFYLHPSLRGFWWEIQPIPILHESWYPWFYLFRLPLCLLGLNFVIAVISFFPPCLIFLPWSLSTPSPTPHPPFQLLIVIITPILPRECMKSKQEQHSPTSFFLSHPSCSHQSKPFAPFLSLPPDARMSLQSLRGPLLRGSWRWFYVYSQMNTGFSYSVWHKFQESLLSSDHTKSQGYSDYIEYFARVTVHQRYLFSVLYLEISTVVELSWWERPSRG